MNKIIKSIVVAFGLLNFSLAQTALFTSSNTDSSNNFTGTLPEIGTRFQISSGQSLTITDLGAYDSGGDGFASSKTVTLWSLASDGLSSSTSLGSVTLTGTEALSSGYRYKTLTTSVVINSGIYAITVNGFSGADQYSRPDLGGSAPTLNTYGGIVNQTFTGSAAGRTLSLYSDNVSSFGWSDFGAGVQIKSASFLATIPEPSTYILSIISILLIIGISRSKNVQI